MISIEERLDRFSPLVCRLLAREGESNKSIRPLTDEAIATASGLPLDVVISMSWRCSWEGVPVDIMLRFSTACGVVMSDRKIMAKHLQYLRSPKNKKWSYLKRSSLWDSKWYPMIMLYSKHLGGKYAKK